MGTYLKNSFIVTIIITVGQVRHRDPRGLRVRVPRVPVQADPVRRVPRHVDGAVRGHDRHQRHHDQRPRAVQHLRGARRAVPRHRLRRVPDAPGVPDRCRTSCATPPRSTATGTGASSWRVAVPLARPAVARAHRVRVPRRRGTSTSGRCSSPRTTGCGRCRSACSSCSRSSIDQLNVTFAGAVIAVDPARDPAAVLPEAARAGPDRRRGQGMSACWWPRMGTDAGVVTIGMLGRMRDRRGVHMLGVGAGWSGIARLVAVRRGAGRPRGAANSTTCPLTALKKASKPVEITCGTR